MNIKILIKHMMKNNQIIYKYAFKFKIMRKIKLTYGIYKNFKIDITL